MQPVGISGRVSAVRGLTVSVSDFPVPIGAGCLIARGRRSVEARVVGFSEGQTVVMPMGPMAGICRGDAVRCTSSSPAVAVGPALLGRVIDGRGRPIDGRGPVAAEGAAPIWAEPMDPMRRRRITEPLPTGVRAIDAMLTVAQGQRMGVFSASGVGKSVLLGMISRHTQADVSVIALIGERGREVRDFIENDLGPAGLERAVVVVSTGDEPPPVRVQAAATATAVAEYFRDTGRDVLLLMDSVTRLATAQRQIGLAAGEPPATKGYPPSVFNLLPELLERCGRTESGSITGFYAVLVEAEDPDETICEAVRSVTDGHIWLSRALANRGSYPAVDCLQSISRVMKDVTGAEHRLAVREIRKQIAVYAGIEDMVNIGAYRGGSNVECDCAIRAMPMIRRFLGQRVDEAAEWLDTQNAVKQLVAAIEAPLEPVPIEG